MKIVEQSDSKLVLESGLGFVASTTHIFDKPSGKYTTTSKGLIGAGNHAEHALSEFNDVHVEEMQQTGADAVNNRIFRLTLIKAAGGSLPLTKEYTGGLKAYQKMAEAIKPFLATT